MPPSVTPTSTLEFSKEASSIEPGDCVCPDTQEFEPGTFEGEGKVVACPVIGEPNECAEEDCTYVWDGLGWAADSSNEGLCIK